MIPHQPLLMKMTLFSNVKQTHSHEISKQLDGYLAATAEGVNTLAPYPAVRNPLTKAQHNPASFRQACERLFSIAGLLFTPRRGSIHSQNFENQLLLKLNKDFMTFDWIEVQYTHTELSNIDCVCENVLFSWKYFSPAFACMSMWEEGA